MIIILVWWGVCCNLSLCHRFRMGKRISNRDGARDGRISLILRNNMRHSTENNT